MHAIYYGGLNALPKHKKTGTAGVVENLGGHMFLRQNLIQQKGFMVEMGGGSAILVA